MDIAVTARSVLSTFVSASRFRAPFGAVSHFNRLYLQQGNLNIDIEATSC